MPHALQLFFSLTFKSFLLPTDLLLLFQFCVRAETMMKKNVSKEKLDLAHLHVILLYLSLKSKMSREKETKQKTLFCGTQTFYLCNIPKKDIFTVLFYKRS